MLWIGLQGPVERSFRAVDIARLPLQPGEFNLRFGNIRLRVGPAGEQLLSFAVSVLFDENLGQRMIRGLMDGADAGQALPQNVLGALHVTGLFHRQREVVAVMGIAGINRRGLAELNGSERRDVRETPFLIAHGGKSQLRKTRRRPVAQVLQPARRSLRPLLERRQPGLKLVGYLAHRDAAPTG